MFFFAMVNKVLLIVIYYYFYLIFSNHKIKFKWNCGYCARRIKTLETIFSDIIVTDVDENLENRNSLIIILWTKQGKKLDLPQSYLLYDLANHKIKKYYSENFNFSVFTMFVSYITVID